jgi:hypothetical protein
MDAEGSEDVEHSEPEHESLGPEVIEAEAEVDNEEPNEEPLPPDAENEDRAEAEAESPDDASAVEVATVEAQDTGEAVATIVALKSSHPGNRMAKHFEVEYYNSLDQAEQADLLRVCRSGTHNPDSGMGCCKRVHRLSLTCVPLTNACCRCYATF